MRITRRLAALGFAAACSCFGAFQDQDEGLPDHNPRFPDVNPHPDDKLPNGKSRSDAIATEQHKKALDEADQLIKLCQDLKKEISDAGRYVVPVATVRKTEEIEKLVKRIRGRLQS